MITHEAPGDTFWDKIRTGAEAAAAKDNIDLKYSTDPAADKQADADPERDRQRGGRHRDHAVHSGRAGRRRAGGHRRRDPGRRVQRRHRPVQGARRADVLRLRRDHRRRGGRRAASPRRARKHPLCVIQEAGSVAAGGPLRRRRRRTRPARRTSRSNGRDLPSVTSTIGAKLQQDPSIDYVVTLGAQFAMAALDAVDPGRQRRQGGHLRPQRRTSPQRSRTARSSSRSISSRTCRATWRSTSLWLYLTNSNDLGGGMPVLTGPSFVDAHEHRRHPPVRRRTTPADVRPGEGRHAPGRRHRIPGARHESIREDPAAGQLRRRAPASSRRSRVTLVRHPGVGPAGDRARSSPPIVIYIFFFIVAPPFRSPESFSTILYAVVDRSASSRSGSAC